MRLTIESTQDELSEKTEDLVKALADVIGAVRPDIAAALEKAVAHDHTNREMYQPALRDIHKVTAKAYKKRLKWMLKDIGKVLDRSIAKAEGDEPEEYVPEEEKPGPGDPDPETGELIPEKEEEDKPEGDGEEKEP